MKRDLKKPLVSVLIPCRQRSAWLKEAINSVVCTASHPDRVEVLVRADLDDPALREIEATAKWYGSKLVVGKRGRGYLDLHLMYSELARKAAGHWVWMFNDDARITLPPNHEERWDDVLEGCLDGRDETGATYDVCLVNPGNARGERTTVFPIVRRSHVEIFNMLTPSPANDHFLQDLYHEADAKYHLLNLRVDHMNNHPAGQCETRSDSIKAASPAIEEHYSDPVQAKFWEMKARLVDHKAKHPRRPWE